MDEFFGAARKSSKRHFVADSEDEGSSDLGVESDGGGSDDDDNGEGVMFGGRYAETTTGIDIQDIMEKRR